MSFAFGLGLATVVCWVALALMLWWFRPPRPLWPVILWYIFSGLLWSTGELGATFLASDAATAWRWTLLVYTGILANAPLWWSLTLRFVGQYGARPSWARRSVELAPLGLAAICWIALVTNPWHGEFLEPVWRGRNHYRLFWYVQAVAAYACMLGSLVLLLRARSQPDASQRAKRQLSIVAVAMLLPLAANALYLTRLVEFEMDPTILGFGLGLGLVFFGIAREQLFALSGVTFEHWLERETDGVVAADFEGRLLRSNRAAAALLDSHLLAPGLDFVECLATRLEHVDGTPIRQDRLLATLLEARQPKDGHRYRSRRRPERRLRLTSTPVPGRWPRRSAMILRLRDETELYAATERAGRQASSIEAILGSIGDGLLVVEAGGKLLYANDRFRSLWGMGELGSRESEESELFARLRASVRDPRPLERAAARAREGEGERAVDGGEVTTLTGQVIAVSATPLLHGDDVAGRVWSFRDVTDRRRAEEERRRIEERMRQSQKLESLGMLAGGIAHDFNNILVGILGNADLASHTLDPDSSASRHLLSAKRSAGRAAELIHQLLTYAGRGRVEVDVFDLSSLVEETLLLLRSAISKKAELEVDLAPALEVAGDPVQLRQIAMNLIVNASDALEGRSGRITLRTTVERLDVSALDDALPRPESLAPGAADYVCLEISDTGCGMDTATTSRIFEPFYSTKVAGQGLGLSATLGILKSHGGFVRVRSAPGEGSTFVLLLPLASDETPRRGRSAASPPASAVAPGTVLVVDDEEAVRSVAQSALELGGFRVMLARDGQEGLETFRSHASGIDAVVLDMTMPRMDGAETLFAIRQISREIPVILSSGYSEQDTMNRCTGLSGVSFVQKPYTAQELLAHVREAIARAPRPQNVSAAAGVGRNYFEE